MASQNVQSKMETPQLEPCYKKKAAEGKFMDNVKDHFNEFVNTPMDLHMICLKKKMHGVGQKIKKSGSKFVPSTAAEEKDLGAKKGQSSPQVQPSTHQ